MSLPDPPIPEDIDLRGLETMPLFFARLPDSRFRILTTGDEFKAGIILWCKAFAETPAGSLPDDDVTLAFWAGVPFERWTEMRPKALHGWELASNGRLYNATLAEGVMASWNARVKYEQRSGSFSEKQRQRAISGWAKRRAKAAADAAACGKNAAAMPRQYRGNANEGEIREDNTPPLPPSGEGGEKSLPLSKRAGGDRRQNIARLPEGWTFREDERRVAVKDLKMTDAEFADAEAAFREWASKNGRRIKDGSSPNWDLAFRNDLRKFARQIGASFRREAPQLYIPPKPDSDAPEWIPEGPPWFVALSRKIAKAEPAAWKSCGRQCRGVEVEGEKHILVSGQTAQERMRRIVEAIDPSIFVFEEGRGAAR